MDQYGTPHYCKVDIEGQDRVALESLTGGQLPRFISAEAECGTDHVLSDKEALAVLDVLRDLGYTGFKLVEQATLHVLTMQRRLYEDPGWRMRLRRYAHRTLVSARTRWWFFAVGVSGPFGEDLPGRWQDYEDAKATLLHHRRLFYDRPNVTPYGFWCDWHATR